MAKTKISEFSATPANNTDIDSINIAEGCAPSGINDAIRELMAQLKDFQTGAVGDSFNGPVGTSTAAAGAFTTLSSTGNTTLGDASGDSVTINGTATFANANPTLTAGTANGVTYLNGSKVLTSGSALTYSATSGLTTNGVTQGYNTTLYTVDGTLSNYSAANNVYLNGNTAGGLNLRGDGTGGASTQLFLGGATSSEANKIIFTVASSEGMRLTSTGLGIGTSSPATKLNLYGSNVAGVGQLKIDCPSGDFSQLTLFQNNVNQAFIRTNGSSLDMGSSTSIPFGFFTNGNERMRLDSAGNLGLGVTPSAWGSAYKMLQASTGASFGGTGNIAIVGSNYYNDGSSKYIGTGLAALYLQDSGVHKFFTAASGTAGNAISFTQAMTLEADGDWILGGTATVDGSRAQIYGSKTLSSGIPQQQLNIGDTSGITTGAGGGISFSAVFTGTSLTTMGSIEGVRENGTSGNYAGALVFKTRQNGANNNEGARIDSSGNLLVGKTTTVLSSKILSSFNGATQNGIVLDDPLSTSAAGFIAMSIGNGTYCGSVSRVGSTSAVVYTATSDRRLKENIVDAPSALAHINSVKVRSFNWIDGGHQIKYGVIAQEFFDVEPDAVIQGDSGETIEKTWSVDTSALVPAMIKAIQEQQALITQLQADIATLKG